MTRPHRFLPILAVLGTLLLSGSSCRTESEPVRLPAGLKIQSARPDFPVMGDFGPIYVLYDVEYPATLSYELNEPAVIDEITVQFFPAPSQNWQEWSSTTSGIFRIDDFDPRPDTGMQRILIDGPRFVRPWLHEFLVRTRDWRELGFIDGQVFHRFANGPEVVNAVMYFYDAATASGVASASELFDLPPQSAVLADWDLSEDGEMRARRIVDHLVYGELYTMAAILDTSGDGVYDPEVDWWGTAGTPGSTGWLPLFVPATRDGLEEQLFLLKAEMLPPPVR